ncbi:NAD-dependent epimerase/dehydratase family protein [Nonomuraea zeae]|uniref:NAD(P)-dependent oxidoreductase n=1 Tax=Nonomuraea zeae TaxID=1642303 RepID=A0A5S4GS40_9ACTN|nr:NAD(P)-dependent oxidoreductase [Nonomuraea zeae]TMR35304.1 NAD(P)-dependent oxidoreductase [Nonomuraea zeae]
MEIIGRGFLARNLRSRARSHPGVVVLAAGVTDTRNASEADYHRESAFVYDWLRRCGRWGETLVFFSTASAGMYGAEGCPGREDGFVFPGTHYGRHKLALERVIALSGVRHLILRLGHVAGPDQQPHQLLPSLVEQVRSGVVTVYRGACRDMIDVADAVTILDELLDTGHADEVVNVASGVSVPAELIVDHLQERLGLAPERIYVDAHGTYSVSLARLTRLVPAVAELGFGPGYYRSVIDRYVEVAAHV